MFVNIFKNVNLLTKNEYKHLWEIIRHGKVLYLCHDFALYLTFFRVENLVLLFFKTFRDTIHRYLNDCCMPDICATFIIKVIYLFQWKFILMIFLH